jgi:hypothetical protein
MVVIKHYHGQEVKMRVFSIMILFCVAVVSVGNAEENNIRVVDIFEIDKSKPRGLQEKNTVRVLCIDGYKFVSSYGWSAWRGQSGVGTGAGVSLVQFYEEKDGKTAPARCNLTKEAGIESNQEKDHPNSGDTIPD